MVVLVIGGTGQLGQALRSVSGKYPEINFYFATSSEANILDPSSLQSIFDRTNPDFCINAAAYTAVDKAETESEQAFDLNVTGVKNTAEICSSHDTVLVHISTDFVFDGAQTQPYCEEDATNPQSVYGKTKLQGEEAIAAVFDRYYIIRTSWLYSEFGNNFMKTMLRLGKERDVLNVVDDQIGTPTHAVDLAEAIVQIIQSKKNAFGIYHYSNEGETSWYNFAKEIFKSNGIQLTLNPITTSDYPTPAARPKYSVLDKTKIKSVFGIKINDWHDSLKNK